MPHRLLIAFVFCCLLMSFGGEGAFAQLLLPATVSGSQRNTIKPSGVHVSVFTATHEAVIGRPLHLNGISGTIELSKTGNALVLSKFILAGHRISRPGDQCQVEIMSKSPLQLSEAGRSNGVLSYESKMPVCSFSLDILQGALMLKTAANLCSFVDADCNTRPDGMWGPSPAAISPAQIQADVHARTLAETSLRSSFRQLMDHQKDAVIIRTLASEQAAFSSQREEMCRDYMREDRHGFCAARFTEHKLTQIHHRLSLNPALQKPSAPLHSKSVNNAPLQLN